MRTSKWLIHTHTDIGNDNTRRPKLASGTNDTRVSAETVRRESTYIILFLTRHNGSINDDKTTIISHRPRVSLARFSFCWWRHNRLLMTPQWPDNCDAITWIVMFNSLDIDFIHGDIHGRSCTKSEYSSNDEDYRINIYHIVTSHERRSVWNHRRRGLTNNDEKIKATDDQPFVRGLLDVTSLRRQLINDFLSHSYSMYYLVLQILIIL